MNKLKEKKEDQVNQQGAVGRSISDLVNGNFLVRRQMIRHLPFFFFVIFLALVYIGNGYYAEDTVIELNRLSGEMKELRSEYISTKSELMFRSKQSEVARLLEPYGLRESLVPPEKLELPPTDTDGD